LCEPEIGPVVMVGWTVRSSSAVINASFPTPALPGQVHAVGGTWSSMDSKPPSQPAIGASSRDVSQIFSTIVTMTARCQDNRRTVSL
jgi:hypothetical protein